MGVSLERGAMLHKRYRIVDILGQGGMGSVYRAVDENLGVDVAVKENLFTTDEYARQFRLEAVILANLRHPNLPRVTDHFVVADQGQYLIMDYIEGEDLRQRMERSGSLSEQEAILIGAAMSDALQYLHTRKPSIIHRDVKPGNVRIAPEGNIFLVDFGLAKLVKGTQATTTGARAMTPGYSPPEQYGTARTDSRTDIYSLGATLYAALTGVIPEDGLARAMDNVELTPVRQRNPKISGKLASAIEKAMAVRPENRFQTAEEFRQALLTSNISTQNPEGQIAVDPLPDTGTPQGNEPEEKSTHPDGKKPPPRPPALARRSHGGSRPWILFSFFLLILLVGILAGIALWPSILASINGFFSRPTPEMVLPTGTGVTFGTPTATLYLPDLTAASPPTPTTIHPSIVYPTSTETSLPSATASGGGSGQIAFASDRAGVPQVFLMNADGSGPRQLTNMPDGACQPSWSPDGMQLVFTSPCLERKDQYPEGRLYTISAEGSGLVELAAIVGGGFDPDWSPDGNRIAFTSQQEGALQISVLNLADNSLLQLTRTDSDTRLPDWSFQPAWTPNGTQITFTGHSRLTGTLQIWMMSDAGRGQTLLVRSGPEYWDSQPTWSPNGNLLVLSQANGDQILGWLMKFDPVNNPTADATKLRAFGIHADVSPNSRLIAYESMDLQNTGRHDFDIYSLSIDGTTGQRLTNEPGMEFDPDWRPIASP